MTAQVPDFVPQRAPQPSPAAPPPLTVQSFPDLIALANEKRDLAIKSALERDVRLVRFEDGRLEIALEPSARKTLVNDLSRKVGEWTGRRWMIAVSTEEGAPSWVPGRRPATEAGAEDALIYAALLDSIYDAPIPDTLLVEDSTLVFRMPPPDTRGALRAQFDSIPAELPAALAGASAVRLATATLTLPRPIRIFTEVEKRAVKESAGLSPF